MRRSAIRSAFLMSLGLTPAIAGCSGAEEISFSSGGGTGTSTAGAGGAGANGGGGSTTQGGSGGAIGGGGSGAQGGAGGAGAQGGAGAGGQTGGGGAATVCGDGVKSGGEECDGAALGGASCCFDYGFSKANGVTCAPDCTLDPSGCAPTCDGALLEPGETCDGEKLGAATCVDFGYVNPAGLGCNPTCDELDASGCTAACNGKLEPGEACDGMDLGGHDCTEYGFANPMGLTCEACALQPVGCKATCGNGVMEPNEACDDGNVASGDGCSAACVVEGVVCGDAIKVSLGLGTQNFTGTTAGGGARNGLCASAGPDRVYAVTATAAGFLTATLIRANTAYPSVLYARTTCDAAATEILCADSKDPAGVTPLFGGEVVSFPVNANQVVYIFVDGAAANDAGNYALSLDLSVGTNCNDPVPIRMEHGTPMRLLGLTTGKSASGSGSCGGGGIGFGSEDVVYDIKFAAAGQSTIALDAAGTSYNSVLYLRNECNNGFAEISCDNPGGNGGESLNVTPAAGASVWTWVDGNQGANGTYTMVVTPPP